MKWNKNNPRYKKPKETLRVRLGNFFINFGKKLSEKKGLKQDKVVESKILAEQDVYKSLFSNETLEEFKTGEFGEFAEPSEIDKLGDTDEIGELGEIDKLGETDEILELNSKDEIIELLEKFEEPHLNYVVDNTQTSEDLDICLAEEELVELTDEIKKDKKLNNRILSLITITIILLIIAGGGFVLFKRYLDEKTQMLDKEVKTIEVPILEYKIEPGPYELENIREEKVFFSESEIKNGETLGHGLERVGLPINGKGGAIIDLVSKDKIIPVVKAGDKVKAYWNDSEKTSLNRLEYYALGSKNPLTILETYDGTFWYLNHFAPSIMVREAVESNIESSLWEAGQKVGLDGRAIMTIAELLESEIDLLTDIKAGNTFQILYQREYFDAEAKGPIVIDMLKLQTSNRDIELYRHTKNDGSLGYYDVDGHSTKKAFLISPLQYTRISSGYNLRRMHPIHKVVRPHQGVDYAAPKGTPVSAVADGIVDFSGWSGGYGQLVVLKHGSIYTTMYAHLSRIDKAAKKGKSVKQGDVVGYVGATGTATGPHLDFRLKRNGVFIDPLPELAKQEGAKLASTEMSIFAGTVTQAREKMKLLLSSGNSEIIKEKI